jgi:hypothetical protein
VPRLKGKQHPRFRDRSGERYGRLLVIRLDGFRDDRSFWVCRCDCGRQVTRRLSVLLGGQQSCGCLRHETKPALKHGQKCRNGMTPEYDSWIHMRQRCNNPNNKDFKHYGGRDISVCERWLDSFENFFEDMGPKPSANHSIDRIDNDSGYSPDNCRWATKSEQSSNRRVTKGQR